MVVLVLRLRRTLCRAIRHLSVCVLWAVLCVSPRLFRAGACASAALSNAAILPQRVTTMKHRSVADQLQKYRRKRNFVSTPEPTGHPGHRPAQTAPMYVVQKHAATRLHYDFRLELDGTLKSWAVPKGPSLDPSQKRLAVHVEDHPLEYAEFEGVIPPKQYGAGTVLIWDRGVWSPLGSPTEGYRHGVLKFRLDGEKLHGAWTLVRMQRRRNEGRDNGKENWLLIKEQDGDAKRGKAGEIVEVLTDSVASGRGIHEIGGAGARVWQ